MKTKKVVSLLMCIVLVLSLLSGCGRKANNNTANDVPGNNSNNVQPVPAISEEEMAKLIDIDVKGLEPVDAEKLKEGKYDITVQSGSEQFKIKSSKLMVVGNALQLVIDVEGTAYSKMFMGSAKDAASAADPIIGEQNADGTTTFRLPVESLNEVVECAAYADEYGKWFDRTIMADASTLPKDAFKEDAGEEGKEDEQKQDDQSGKIADGEYTIEFTFTGGTGKARLVSPATVFVNNGKYTLLVSWTSPNYDYMKVKGIKYYPVNTSGNSQFKFPVTSLSGSLPVIGDTTAMSTPHEIDYVMTFVEGSLKYVGGRTDDGRNQQKPAGGNTQPVQPTQPETPVTPDEPDTPEEPAKIEDGTYKITLDKSKMYMFAMKDQDKETNTAPAKLIVKDGKMTAVITYNGTGKIDNMFVGTAEAAQTADAASYIPAEVKADGENDTFTLPVEALDTEITYASHSIKTGNWSDQVITFKSEGMEKIEDETPEEPAKIEDGTYKITLDKSKMYMFAIKDQDKATNTAPAKLIVKDGKMTAVITYNGTGKVSEMYVGTAEAAQTAVAEDLIPAAVKADGENDTFTLPVAELDKELNYASHSISSGKWNDQIITFKSEGMEKIEEETPEEPAKIEDGTYKITLDKSKMYMFAIKDQDKATNTAPAKLIVKDGKMTAVITYNGTGKVSEMYVGTAEAAQTAAAEDLIPAGVKADGENDTFTLPVAELDKELNYASHSISSGKWNDQIITFKSEGMEKITEETPADPVDPVDPADPADPVDPADPADPAMPAEEKLQDGDYKANIVLGGGSGKTTITSATLHVKDGAMTATIVWSSSGYSYMKMGESEEQILPTTTEGGSTFEIPVEAFDKEISVIAYSDKMAKEIAYTLTFESATLEKVQ